MRFMDLQTKSPQVRGQMAAGIITGVSRQTGSCPRPRFSIKPNLQLYASVTQNLPSLTKLTSLPVRVSPDSITYVVATQPGEFGLQVRLPQTSRFTSQHNRKSNCDTQRHAV